MQDKILLGLVSLLTLSAVFLAGQEKPLQMQDNSENLFQLYESWKIKFGKVTNDFNDYKFAVFVENYEVVQAHNSQNSSYKLGLNQFADMTDLEFKESILMNNQQQQESRRNLQQDPVKNPQEFFKGHVNFQNKGVLNAVQDQGHCGSCYSFAAAAALESAYKLQTDEPLHKFSEQQIVSCSQAFGNNGCGGGFGDASFSYVIDKGITLWEDFPYISGEDGLVPACSVKEGQYNISSYTQVVGLGHCLNQQIANVDQPLYGRVVADNWKLYESGIFNNCSDKAEDINHGIAIVGFDTESDEAGERYWIIRNSWGPTWGEQGYMKLKFGNTCAICHDSYFPTV